MLPIQGYNAANVAASHITEGGNSYMHHGIPELSSGTHDCVHISFLCFRITKALFASLEGRGRKGFEGWKI